MGKVKKLLLLALAGVMLCGCSMNYSAEETSVYVNKKGEIVGAIVEDFDESLYDGDELQEMLAQDVTDYNAANGVNNIKVDSYKVKDNKIKIMMEYSSWADYAHFNDVQFFAGVVSDIQGKGYGENVTFLAKDGSDAGLTLDEMDGDDYVVMLDEKIVVQTSAKIKYVSSNVTLEGDKLARVKDDSDGLAFIIYGK